MSTQNTTNATTVAWYLEHLKSKDLGNELMVPLTVTVLGVPVPTSMQANPKWPDAAIKRRALEDARVAGRIGDRVIREITVTGGAQMGLHVNIDIR